MAAFAEGLWGNGPGMSFIYLRLSGGVGGCTSPIFACGRGNGIGRGSWDITVAETMHCVRKREGRRRSRRCPPYVSERGRDLRVRGAASAPTMSVVRRPWRSHRGWIRAGIGGVAHQLKAIIVAARS